MINNLSFLIHGGSSGVAASVASLLEFIEGLSDKTPPEIFFSILPGIAVMENIHPLLVHFPIAFFTAFFLIDILGVVIKQTRWRYVAACLLYMGTFAAVFTVIAGLFAADSIAHNENVHQIMERHENIGITILSLGLFLSAWRMKQWGLHSASGNTAFLCLAGLLCFLLLLGADLGGLMVYHYGVAVQPTAISQNTSPSSDYLTDPKAIDHQHELETEGTHAHHHNGHDHANGGHHHSH